jgi:hypothetical protein
MLEFFPSYGPTQFAAAGAFHHQALAGMAALSLAWTAVFALLGLAVPRLRMPRPAASPGPPWTGPPQQPLTTIRRRRRPSRRQAEVPVATRVKAVCQQTSAWSRLPPPGPVRTGNGV